MKALAILTTNKHPINNHSNMIQVMNTYKIPSYLAKVLSLFCSLLTACLVQAKNAVSSSRKIGVLLNICAFVLTPGFVSASQVLPVLEDAFVKGNRLSQTVNGSVIQVRNDVEHLGFLKFDLSEVTGPIVTATLDLTVKDVNSGTPGFNYKYKETGDWNETTINFSNQPTSFITPSSSANKIVSTADVEQRISIPLDVELLNSSTGQITLQLYQPNIYSGTSADRIQFYSKDAAGGKGATLTVTTAQEPSVVPVEINVSASDPTASGFIFNYDVVNPNATGGEADVTLYWGKTDGVDQPSGWEHNLPVSTAVSTGNYIEVISGLQAETTYYFNASAENEGGASWAVTSSFTTASLPPSVYIPSVTADVVQLTSTNSATLPFTITNTGGEDPTVLLSWSAEGSTIADTYDFGSNTFPLGSYEHEITGLDSATNYAFTVEATNTAGTSTGDSQNFTTQAEPPAGGGGTTWLTEAGAPDNINGNDGDLYLNTNTGDYYVKTDGTWGSPIGNLTGPQGVVGPAGPAGPAGPEGPQGPAGASPFVLNGSDVYYTSGKVGIGTDAPSEVLDVSGNVLVDGTVIVHTNNRQV